MSLPVGLLLSPTAWAQMVNPHFDDGLDGWTVEVHGDLGPPGAVTPEDGAALLTEGGSFLVVLEQTFQPDPRMVALSFVYELAPGFDLGQDALPDAFEARLLDADQHTLVAPWEAGNTAYFNLQETLVAHPGPQVSVTPEGGGWRVRLETPSLDGPVTLSFSLVGGDRDELSAVRIVDVDTEITNDGPLADAGGERTFECGVDTITLDGTGSSDPDGDPLTWLWTDALGTVGTDPVIPLELPLGSWSYVLTVTDPFGLSDDDEATVIVVDTLPPVIPEPPGDLALEEDGTCTANLPDLTDVDVLDACGGVTVTQDPPPGTPLPSGSSGTVTLTLTDAAGNASELSLGWTVTDPDTSCTNFAPDAMAGADVRAECGTGGVTLDGSGSTDPDGDPLRFRWTDAGGATVSTDPLAAVDPDLGTWVYTLQVEDPDGLSDSDGVTVRVIDSVPPEIDGAPGDRRVEEDGSCLTGVVPDLTAGLLSHDACSEVTLRQEPPAGSDLPLGAHTVVVIAEDGSGNRLEIPVSLTVVDDDDTCANRPPVADAGADLTHECGTTPAVLDGSASADPDGDPLGFAWTDPNNQPLGDQPTQPTNPGVGVWRYQLAVTDPDGLADTDEVVLTVVDTVQPEISGAPGEASVEEDGSCLTGIVPDLTPGVAAEDACTQPTLVQDPPPGTAVPLGSTTVTLVAEDEAGHTSSAEITLRVVDSDDSCGNLPPVADAGVDLTHECGPAPARLDGSASVDPDGDPLGFAWTDPNGQPAGDQPVIEVNPGPGAWRYELVVTDPAGLSGSDDVLLTVVDTQPPAVETWPADLRLEEDGSCASAPAPELRGEVTATDACGGVTVDQAPPAGTDLPLGETEVTLSVQDGQGHTTSHTVVVSVVDDDLSCVDDPPVADAGADVTAECGPGAVSLDGSASFDPEGLALGWRWSGPGGDLGDTPTVDVPASPAGDVAYTLQVTDPGGQQDDDTTTVSVLDRSPPVLVDALGDAQVEEDGGCLSAPLPDWTAGGATDACDGLLAAIQEPPPGTPVDLGDGVEVTVSATDRAGNRVEVRFQAEVVDADGSCVPDTEGPVDTDETESEPDPPDTDIGEPDTDPDSDGPPPFGTDKDEVTRQWRGGCGCETGGVGVGWGVLGVLLWRRRRS